MSESLLSSGPAAAVSASDRMNSGCYCVSLDPGRLRLALAAQLGSAEIVALVELRCPYLFAAMPVFISADQAARMESVVRAVEFVVALPSYQREVLARAPAIARHAPAGARGVFFGYDFHLRGGGVGLIEINTNAGGAMLNAVLARAHRACSLGAEQLSHAAAAGAVFEQNIVDMFHAEWDRADRGRPLKSIAIVDNAPDGQYLYPEFLLFQNLFERHGLRAVIADPAEFSLREGVLWCGDLAIDLVYNRLTDFMLETEESATLRSAYLADAVVLTPHPHAHALYADKRNLAILSDAGRLRQLGVPEDVQAVLRANVLSTEVVDAADGERLWSARRQLFFKPNAGFGGRAAYRGDKLTRRVWQEILAGDYVAQHLMMPGERASGSQEDPALLKFDLRLYTYAGASQWIAARVYQGQTTNFRTPGGGFAPVYCVAEPAAAPADLAACCAAGCA